MLNTDFCLGRVESIQAEQLLTSTPKRDDDNTEPKETQHTPQPPPPVAKAKPAVAPKPKV